MIMLRMVKDRDSFLTLKIANNHTNGKIILQNILKAISPENRHVKRVGRHLVLGKFLIIIYKCMKTNGNLNVHMKIVKKVQY